MEKTLEQQIKFSDEYYHWRIDSLNLVSFFCSSCGVLGRQKTVLDFPERPILYVINKYGFKELMKVYEIDSFEKALKCEKLWDVSAGIVLCQNCYYKNQIKKINKRFSKK